MNVCLMKGVMGLIEVLQETRDGRAKKLNFSTPAQQTPAAEL